MWGRTHPENRAVRMHWGEFTVCLPQQGYDGEMAVRSAGCTLTPPSTLMRLILFIMFHIYSIPLAPLSLLFSQGFIYYLLCIYWSVYMLILNLASQRSGDGFCCSFGGGCGVALRDVTGFNTLQMWCVFERGFVHKGESCSVVWLRGLCSSAGGHYPIHRWCWGCGACQCC